MLAGPSRGTRDQVWSGYLRRCVEGDQAALAGLYDESSRFVYGMALRILRDTADAEEITIDVFSQVWRSASAFTLQRGSVLTWLVTLTRSRAIDRLRTQSAKARRKKNPSIPSSPFGTMPPTRSSQWRSSKIARGYSRRSINSFQSSGNCLSLPTSADLVIANWPPG